MRPDARLQSAIEILDQILTGTPSEQALTTWARRNRYAGSKDRAAIRDHVFDAVRRKRSYAARGGALTGRGLILGAMRSAGLDPGEGFTGKPHAPEPLTPTEAAAGRTPQPGPEEHDMPDWIWPLLREGLGKDAEAVAAALQTRAPVHLRLNFARTTGVDAMSALHAEKIEAQPHHAVDTALIVTRGARKVRHAQAFLSGLVELQDASSQAVVNGLPLRAGMRVLDYCAGGGGKTLAMAARMPLQMFAHDASPSRMQGLAERADRAQVQVTQCSTKALGTMDPFDLVLCDAPCSGSGAWRRSPDGKWRLTDDMLASLTAAQDDILLKAAGLVAPNGWLAYATCSVLAEENQKRIATFLDRCPEWRCSAEHNWLPDDTGDGFFVAHLKRADNV